MDASSPKKRFQVTPSVYVILARGDRILLSRRYRTGYCDGQYSLPAGHLDGNEASTAAMLREAKEEIGITLDPGDLEPVHLMHRKSDDERYDLFFVARKWNGEPRIMEPHKCDDLRWVEAGDLPANTIPYIAQAVAAWTRGIFYSEHGWS